MMERSKVQLPPAPANVTKKSFLDDEKSARSRSVDEHFLSIFSRRNDI